MTRVNSYTLSESSNLVKYNPNIPMFSPHFESPQFVVYVLQKGHRLSITGKYLSYPFVCENLKMSCNCFNPTRWPWPKITLFRMVTHLAVRSPKLAFSSSAPIFLNTSSLFDRSRSFLICVICGRITLPAFNEVVCCSIIFALTEHK